MERNFVDIHQHLMYGVDDGPKNRKRMYAMLDAAAADGIVKIIATPHATPGLIGFNREQYLLAMDAAKDYCRKKGLNIEIETGAEIFYTEQTCRLLREGVVPTLAETDRVLVEFSPNERFLTICRAIEQLNRNGYVPVLAHVERYRCLVMNPLRAERLSGRLDVMFQMNCDSILNPGGFWERRFVNQMLEWQLIDALGTDAHNTSSRAVRMTAAWQALCERYGHDYACLLTEGRVLGLDGFCPQDEYALR